MTPDQLASVLRYQAFVRQRESDQARNRTGIYEYSDDTDERLGQIELVQSCIANAFAELAVALETML